MNLNHLPASCRATLALVIDKGAALFRDGGACRFMAHRAADVRPLLQEIPARRLRELAERFPPHTLAAPVSREQERNLYHSQVMKQPSLNIRHIYALETIPDFRRLNQALAVLAGRHDILRTYYLPLDDTWAQVVVPRVPAAIRISLQTSLKEFKTFIAQQQHRLFDIAAPPLWRVWICPIGDTAYLGFTAHHSVADAFTSGMLVAELMTCYQALKQHRTPQLPEVGEQYWQYALGRFGADDGQVRESIDFWCGQLADIGRNSGPRLPCVIDPAGLTDERRSAGAGNIISLSPGLGDEIRRFSRDREITYTQLFTAAVALVLIHGMDNDRAMIQFVHNRRDRAALVHTLGEFTDILFQPFERSDMPAGTSVMAMLQTIRRKLLDALKHTRIDFARLLKLTGLNDYAGYYNQSADVVVNSADIDSVSGTALDGQARSLFADMLPAAPPSGEEPRAVATLFYQILRIDGRMHLITAYRKHLFDAGAMHRLSTLMVDMVAEMIRRPDQTVTDLLAGFADRFAPLRGRAAAVEATPQHKPGRKLSEGQKGLWLLQRMAPEMTAYNIPAALRISGAIQADLLAEACRYMLQKHPILRTAFLVDDEGTPRQMVDDSRGGQFSHQRVATVSGADFRARLRDMVRQPFDLEKDLLLRLHLFSESPDRHVLLMVVHHIVFDGACIPIFIRDLFSAYETLCRGGRLAAPPDSTPVYHDFVKWEENLIHSEKGRAHLAYWKERLCGELPLLDLPVDKKRPARQTYNGATCSGRVTVSLTRRLRDLARKEEVSLFVLLLTAYKALLHRYTRQTDLIVGLPTIGRPEKRFENALGYFINMVPLRSAVTGETSFRDFLGTIRQAVAHALDHAAYPFPELVSTLGLSTGASRAPVFQTLFVLQPAVADPPDPESRRRSMPLQIEMVPGIHQEGDYDLSLEIVEDGDGLALHASYNQDCFYKSTVRRFIARYCRLLRAVVRDAGLPVGMYPPAPGGYRRFIRPLPAPADGTPDQFTDEPLVHRMFEDQAARTPDAPALFFRDGHRTYRQLEEDSRRLAGILQANGVGPGRFVSVCMARSFDLITAILAVLRSGGVLMTVDPAFPDARIAAMIAESRPVVTITDQARRSAMEELLRQTHCTLLTLPLAGHDAEKTPVRSAGAVSENDPAYVIYTSGTTGRPKGVLVSHNAIGRHCRTIAGTYGLDDRDRVLQFASPGVDTALEQILPPLLTGAALVLMDEPVWTPETFRRNLDACQISVVDLPPAYLHELLRADAGMQAPASPERPRLIISGGEALPMETVRLWRKSGLMGSRLINAYGPTETTITSLIYEVPADPPEEPGPTVPIGRPLDGETAYVLDAFGRPCPDGIPGELHIGGAGVALGYLNQPALTREKFLPDPFNPGERMYRTGDLARVRWDGNVEYLGRMDRQVKVLGFRVACGEIESILKSLDTIADAAVVAQPGPYGNRLSAFLVPADSARPPAAEQVRGDLQRLVPSFMIPSAFTHLERLPRNAGGKIDRNALEKMEVTTTREHNFAGPRNATERKLVRIWEKVLGIARVGITDNFFALGGHSLASVRLMAEIKKQFDQEPPLSLLFQAPTIAEMGPALDRAQAAPQHPESPLVALKPEGDQPPFFCVHPVGGDVQAYYPLARRFPESYPFYGLRCPGLSGIAHPETVAGLAGVYRRAVQAIQPRGPYRLGGWSMGGLVAYEMARQFEAAGETVALVALIDSYTPQAVRAMETDRGTTGGMAAADSRLRALIDFARELGMDERQVLLSLQGGTGEPDELPARIFQQARKAGLLPPGTEAADVTRFFEVFYTNLQAMNRYRPVPLNARVVLFRASATPGRGIGRPAANGWEELSGLELEVVALPGDHYSLLKKPHVTALGNELCRRFNNMITSKTESKKRKEQSCPEEINSGETLKTAN